MHGDFTRPQSWNYILSTEAAVQNFFSREGRHLFCGHTHHAAVWEQTKKGEFRSKFSKRLRNPAVKAERVCADSAVLKFAGTGKNLTVRIPKDSEKVVRKLLENGRKWRELGKRHLLLGSRLAVCGARTTGP